jgi:hypothetical protein
MEKIYCWACDISKNTGEGNLAHIFLKNLKINNNIYVFALKKLNAEQYKKMLYLVVLALYVLQPVRRNKDYQLCKVVTNTKKIASTPNYKDFNYLDLSTQKFLFYNFKTSGTYHLQEIDVSPELYHILSTFMKFHPNKISYRTYDTN